MITGKPNWICLAALLLGSCGDDRGSRDAGRTPPTDGGADALPGPDASVDGVAPWAWDSIPNAPILFFSKRDDTEGYGETYLLFRDGRIDQLVDNTFENYNPSLSPDGEEIAFHRWTTADDFSSLELYRLVIAGLQEIRLTTDSFASAAPKWSPDGATLVYAAWTDYGAPSEANLFLFDLDTWTPTQLTSDVTHEDNDPAWCGADDIAFKSTRRTREAKEEIHVIGVDGAGLTRLSTTDDWTTGGWESDHDPRCTPDGQWIYFYRFEATRPWLNFTPETWDEVFPANIWRVDRTGNEEQLTFCEHSCAYPIPSEDGALVGYMDKQFFFNVQGAVNGSTSRFMVMDPDGSNVRELFPAEILGDHLSTVEYWDW